MYVYMYGEPFTRTTSESGAYKARGLLLLRARLWRPMSSTTVGGPRDLDLLAGDAATPPTILIPDPVPR